MAVIWGAGTTYSKNGPAQTQKVTNSQANAGANTGTTGSNMGPSKQNQAAGGAPASSAPKMTQSPVSQTNSAPKVDTFQKNSSGGPQLVTYTPNGTLKGAGSVGGQISTSTSTTKNSQPTPNTGNGSIISQSKGMGDLKVADNNKDPIIVDTSLKYPSGDSTGRTIPDRQLVDGDRKKGWQPTEAGDQTTLPQDFNAPINGKFPVTSPFSDPNPRVHPTDKVVKVHTGVDFGAPKGTSVYSAADGEVIKIMENNPADPKNAYGNSIVIQHKDNVYTRYSHLDTIGAKLGQDVAKGEMIGTVGKTGKATGPHLDFEVFQQRKDGTHYVNPEKVIK